MSAPRKIWAAAPAPECLFAARSHRRDERDHLYHHDDVVRELIRAGSNMHVFVDLYGDEAMRSAAAEWRAALAKIAQDA